MSEGFDFHFLQTILGVNFVKKLLKQFQKSLTPDSEKPPVKIFLSFAQILLKNGNFTEDVLHSTLKTDVGRVSRRRWNRALESPPTEIEDKGKVNVHRHIVK